MRTVGLATACAVIATFAVGCGPVVDGTAKPAPNLKPRPLSGQIVTRVLLNDVSYFFNGDLDLTHDDIRFFGSKVWQIITSCRERRKFSSTSRSYGNADCGYL